MENEKEKEKLNKYAERIFLSLNAKNKDEIITEVIVNTDLEKRIEISNAYLQKYDRDLYSDLKSKLNGQFKELAMYLFLPPEEFMSKILKKVLKGFQIDEIAIYEIFTICTQEELKKVELAFKKETGKELKGEIEKNFPSAIRKNLLNLLNTPRNINETPNKSQCEKFAQNLIDISENSWVANEDIFKKIFISRSAEELVLISRYYFNKTGEHIINMIEKRLTNKIRNLLKELIYNVIMPEELFADKINNALKNNNISLLNRILVSRNQIDLKEIKEIYQIKYKNDLKDDIKLKTFGTHQKLCLHLLN